MKKRLWITWEKQRRSIEISKSLNCNLIMLENSGFTRYPKNIYKTLKCLIKIKPHIVFVQNPSMILAAIVCFYCKCKKIPIIVDRHTTFQIGKKFKPTLSMLTKNILNAYTLFSADLTIVTNNYLSKLVERYKGKAFVLQDKLPEFNINCKKKLQGEKYNILYVCSFNADEPYDAVISAAKHFVDEGIFFYITGDYNKIDKNITEKATNNVIFTGYISDNEYECLVKSVDIVLVLTTADYCLLCGCYEALAAEKPLITSNTTTLKEYFEGIYYTENNKKEICSVIDTVLKDKDYAAHIRKLKEKIKKDWDKRLSVLESKIVELTGI